MCNIHDAETHKQLADIQSKKNPDSAHEHYLEAASIYTLLSEHQKDPIFHSEANSCYQKAYALKNITVPNFTIKELAQKTLQELGAINKHKAEHARAHMLGIPHHH